MDNIEFKKSSDVSGYLTVGDWKLYIEVSNVTDGEPFISSWKKDWPVDYVYDYEVTS
jgi:hypothetical protein